MSFGSDAPLSNRHALDKLLNLSFEIAHVLAIEPTFRPLRCLGDSPAAHSQHPVRAIVQQKLLGGLVPLKQQNNIVPDTQWRSDRNIARLPNFQALYVNDALPRVNTAMTAIVANVMNRIGSASRKSLHGAHRARRSVNIAICIDQPSRLLMASLNSSTRCWLSWDSRLIDYDAPRALQRATHPWHEVDHNSVRSCSRCEPKPVFLEQSAMQHQQAQRCE